MMTAAALSLGVNSPSRMGRVLSCCPSNVLGGGRIGRLVTTETVDAMATMVVSLKSIFKAKTNVSRNPGTSHVLMRTGLY